MNEESFILIAKHIVAVGVILVCAVVGAGISIGRKR